MTQRVRKRGNDGSLQTLLPTTIGLHHEQVTGCSICYYPHKQFTQTTSMKTEDEKPICTAMAVHWPRPRYHIISVMCRPKFEGCHDSKSDQEHFIKLYHAAAVNFWNVLAKNCYLSSNRMLQHNFKVPLRSHHLSMPHCCQWLSLQGNRCFSLEQGLPRGIIWSLLAQKEIGELLPEKELPPEPRRRDITVSHKCPPFVHWWGDSVQTQP